MELTTMNQRLEEFRIYWYNKALEDVELILLKKFKFAGMPLIKEIKELKKEVQE